jgi:predicted amidohydrolase
MRLALAQLSCAEGDTAGNLEKARLAIAEAARRGAALVVLPELHITGFLEAEALRLAAEHGMGLSTSFAEAGEHGRVHNTAVLAGPDGRIVSSYRKTHLFDSERPIYAAGSALADPVDLCGVIMGLLICYDVEFPETARRLGLEGAQCLVVPSANGAGPREPPLRGVLQPLRNQHHDEFSGRKRDRRPDGPHRLRGRSQ